MDYEIVELQEATVIGITARTNNFAPDCGAVIGGLWERFYSTGIYEQIPLKSDGKVLGIYSDYAGNERDDYDMTVACRVQSDGQVPEGMNEKHLPAGKYAKFVISGDVQKAVMEFWQKLWMMNLERSFVADFEEYQDGEMENAEIHIYIGLK